MLAQFTAIHIPVSTRLVSTFKRQKINVMQQAVDGSQEQFILHI